MDIIVFLLTFILFQLIPLSIIMSRNKEWRHKWLKKKRFNNGTFFWQPLCSFSRNHHYLCNLGLHATTAINQRGGNPCPPQLRPIKLPQVCMRMKPKNILLITADQWRGDCLSAVGHPTVKTPHLDALAADGIAFRNHFTQCIPCGPSRASLYTGMYLQNHRVIENGVPLDARHTNIALELNFKSPGKFRRNH